MDKSPRKTATTLVSALICLIMAAGIPGCLFPAGHNAFTPQEQRIIRQSDSVMYVTVLPEDSAILRATVQDLPDALLRSEDFKTLAAKMLATVQSPEQDGIGIAAPQVGISRRLAWVQRYDKPGEPWELYPNIRILERSGAVSHDPEGCLSVPPQRAVVPRYGTVIVSWTDPQTLQERRDTVHGYTAVIFQHECDHMEGTVCTDRADSVSVNEAWAAERAAFLEKGAYRKPTWWE